MFFKKSKKVESNIYCEQAAEEKVKKEPIITDLKNAARVKCEALQVKILKDAQKLVDAEKLRPIRRSGIAYRINNKAESGEMSCEYPIGSYFHEEDIQWLIDHGFKIERVTTTSWDHCHYENQTTVDGVRISWE